MVDEAVGLIMEQKIPDGEVELAWTKFSCKAVLFALLALFLPVKIFNPDCRPG